MEKHKFNTIWALKWDVIHFPSRKHTSAEQQHLRTKSLEDENMVLNGKLIREIGNKMKIQFKIRKFAFKLNFQDGRY